MCCNKGRRTNRACGRKAAVPWFARMKQNGQWRKEEREQAMSGAQNANIEFTVAEKGGAEAPPAYDAVVPSSKVVQRGEKESRMGAGYGVEMAVAELDGPVKN